MPEQLEASLAGFGLVGAAADQARYTHDWPGDLSGRARAIVRPRTTAEVAAIVRLCAEAGVAIVPQGGNTGLVGGATPSGAGDEVVVSLERLDRIREIDAANYTMTVEAGCVLEAIQAAAAAADRLFPLHLGAEGACQIGGNIATNAGGINVLRYGMARDLVLGLEAVLPDGRVWNGLRKLRKNNTGYDLKQLFLGSEGTLGIVTAASVKIFPKPTQVETAYLALASAEAAVALFARARRDLSDLLSAFEILPRRGVDIAVQAMPGLRDPLPSAAPHYVLLEASASGLVDLKGLVDRFLEGVMTDGAVEDGVLATTLEHARSLWRIREGINEAQTRRGRHLRTDVSVPVSRIADFLAKAHARLERLSLDILPLAYGHIGDGNIHFNVVPPAAMPDDQKIAPASVGATLRVVRFRSRTPSRVSSLRTASLRLEAPEPLDRPAWRNPPARATATKAVRSPRSAPIVRCSAQAVPIVPDYRPTHPGAISMRQQGDG